MIFSHIKAKQIEISQALPYYTHIFNQCKLIFQLLFGSFLKI